jgi:hypothetical protein
VDAGLGGRIQLQLTPRVGLGDDGLDGWPLVGRAFGAGGAASDGGLGYAIRAYVRPEQVMADWQLLYACSEGFLRNHTSTPTPMKGRGYPEARVSVWGVSADLGLPDPDNVRLP